MPTLLDGVLERHEGNEPRVLTSDVQAILNAVIRPNNDDDGASVALIAEKARVSTRTVYRVLNPVESKPSISLALADALCLAADSHLKHCHLVWSDGTVTEYTALQGNGVQ